MTHYRAAAAALCTVALLSFAGAMGQERLLGVDTSGSRLYEIDPTNAQTTLVTSISGGGTIGALAYDPATDTLYASSTSLDQLYRLDYKSGVATLIGDYNRPGVDPVMHGLEFVPATGRLYGVDYRDKALVDISKTTGQATFIGTSPLTGFGSIAWDARRGVMFGGDSGTDSLWQIDLSTAAGTLVGPFNAANAGSLGTGMAWSPTYGLLGINNAGSDSLWSIDPDSGKATLIGNLGSSNVISLAFIPEPATALLLFGLLGMARRR